MAEPDEERELILKSQQGDHAAFEALILQYQRMIHSLTYRMTGSLADAEVLAQETFIHAFRQLGAYRGEAKFSSWLYRIAVNLSLNWKNREARQQKLLAEWGEQESVQAHPNAGRAQAVQAALLKLDPKQRAAIVLTTYDGLNHAEAAKILGCSETTVSWRLFMARTKLKKLLSNVDRQEAGHE